jgi:hypothetical protein
MTTSMEVLHSRQADLHTSNTVRYFWHNWPAHSPDLAVPDYFFWNYVGSKVYGIPPANTDD